MRIWLQASVFGDKASQYLRVSQHRWKGKFERTGLDVYQSRASRSALCILQDRTQAEMEEVPETCLSLSLRTFEHVWESIREIFPALVLFFCIRLCSLLGLTMTYGVLRGLTQYNFMCTIYCRQRSKKSKHVHVAGRMSIIIIVMIF